MNGNVWSPSKYAVSKHCPHFHRILIGSEWFLCAVHVVFRMWFNPIVGSPQLGHNKDALVRYYLVVSCWPNNDELRFKNFTPTPTIEVHFYSNLSAWLFLVFVLSGYLYLCEVYSSTTTHVCRDFVYITGESLHSLCEKWSLWNRWNFMRCST